MENKNFLFLILQIIILIFLLTIKNSFQVECDKSTPIQKLDNNCYLTYCTKEEFEIGECIISNSVIKTQWLTNIIDVGNEGFRFINFALTSQGDLFLQTTAYPYTRDNIFFGMKLNGRPYFTISREETLVILLTYLDSSLYTRYNGELINILVEKKNKKREYLMSIGKDENNVEIFDFKNDLVTIFPTKEMTEYLIRSKKFSLFHFIDNNNKNSYILTFIGKKNETKNLYYVLQKYEFFYNSTIDDIDYKKTEYIKKENLDNKNYKYILSCFQTVNRLIICFYYNSNLNYTATLYDSNLNEINNFDFSHPSNEQDLFFKCIHLKQEIGIFYYFLEKKERPKIDIVEFIKTPDGKNYTMKYIFKYLTTKKDNINYKIYYNSILKLNENKFGIIQINENQDEIYIIIYNIFNDNKEIIGRYYKIDIFKLYNLKIHNDIDSILFNSFFVCAFSFCTEKESEMCNNYHSSIIMFSYPDSKDYIINFINYIQINNYKFLLLDDIIKNIKIDNNIYGYIIKGIQIQSYPKDKNNNNIISLFSNNNKKIIKENETIDKNDKIEFFFPQIKINANQYKIEYACVVTEPDYDIYNSYCEIDSDFGNITEEEKHFQKYEYIGKTGYILFDVKKTLSNDCNNIDCFYCLETNKNICLLHKRLDNKEEELSTNNKEESFNNTKEEISDNNKEEISDNNKEESFYNNEIENSDKNEVKYFAENELTSIYNHLIEFIYGNNVESEKVVKNNNKDIWFQLSSVEFQERNINNENTTNVFLGKCKDKLKEKYNLQENELLLMLKVDIFKKNSLIHLVEYEVYNYNRNEKLNLEYCDDIKINIYVPIQLDNKAIMLYNHLNSSRYNLFDINDPFYTDICSNYTTINGTDISLIDREKEYYNESLLLCQGDGCIFDSYDSKIKKVKCYCPISQIAKTENNITNQNENNFINTILEKYNNKENYVPTFSLSRKNNKFKIMKCFKLQFLMKNSGSIAFFILFVFYFIICIFYFASNINKKRIQSNNLENCNPPPPASFNQEEPKDYKDNNTINNDDDDEEKLNSLNYREAINKDKRKFCQYYWSLLKKNLLLLILFTLYQKNNCNIRIIKISFIILSLTLYISINAFFIIDSTIHKIYKNFGESLKNEIRPIFLSTLLIMILSIFLKYLSLSEKNLPCLKKEHAQTFQKIKLIIYFIFGIYLIFLNWFFISIFCSIYSNTQSILIFNSLFSFLISMIIQILYALIPALLRIISLRVKKHNYEFMYKISGVMTII